jgi:hypothetical protein
MYVESDMQAGFDEHPAPLPALAQPTPLQLVLAGVWIVAAAVLLATLGARIVRAVLAAVTLPVLIGFLQLPLEGPMAALAVFGLGLCAFGVMTNQVHQRAHTPVPPSPVRGLQALGVFLRPHDHAAHHSGAYDRHYCITTGWSNPPLEAIRFFRHVVATPAFHHWHHSADREAVDKNFAVHTPVWDCCSAATTCQTRGRRGTGSPEIAKFPPGGCDNWFTRSERTALNRWAIWT